MEGEKTHQHITILKRNTCKYRSTYTLKKTSLFLLLLYNYHYYVIVTLCI